MPPRRRITGHEKRVVAARQAWRCDDCDAVLTATYEVDHVVPLWRGGADDHETNCHALCRECHARKTQRGDRAPAERAGATADAHAHVRTVPRGRVSALCIDARSVRAASVRLAPRGGATTAADRVEDRQQRDDVGGGAARVERAAHVRVVRRVPAGVHHARARDARAAREEEEVVPLLDVVLGGAHARVVGKLARKNVVHVRVEIEARTRGGAWFCSARRERRGTGPAF